MNNFKCFRFNKEGTTVKAYPLGIGFWNSKKRIHFWISLVWFCISVDCMKKELDKQQN